MRFAPAASDLIGQRIGDKYEVRRLIAEGGMGVVYEAVHTDINRRVALKVVHPDIVHDDEGARRFLNEARAVNEARHRNIVEVSDFGHDGERTFLVMEFLEGATLREWREALPEATYAMVLRALLPIGRALSFAHQRGFVHRDVKPENILVAREEGSSEPTPKLLDFGVAKFRGSRERLTRTGATLGTPLYMAPEQIGASRDVGPEADQYAFGCVLYEAIARQPPFDAKSLPALAAAKATGDPPHISIARPDLPVALGDAIARSMTRDPSARWPSMDALCDALEPFVGDATIPWIPAPVAQTVPSMITPTIDVPRPIARPVSVDTGVPETRPPSEPSESMLPSMDGARPAHLSLVASKPPSAPPAPVPEASSSKSAINRDDPTKKVAALKVSPDPIDAAIPATPSSLAPTPETSATPSPWRAVAIGLAVVLAILVAFVATR